MYIINDVQEMIIIIRIANIRYRETNKCVIFFTQLNNNQLNMITDYHIPHK